MGNCLDLKSKCDIDKKSRKSKHKRHSGEISMENPKICLEDFTIIKMIGRGSTSKVYLVKKNDTGKKYAMKVMEKSKKYKKDTQDLKGERMMLEKVRHTFVVGLHYAFQQEYTLYLILGLANGGDLYNYIQKMRGLSEDHARFYASEILCGLEFLHENGIVYRNLKPEDVLLDKRGHIKLSDFGLARSTEDISSTFCGDPYYMAPETIKGDNQTIAVDYWSFGVLLYEMICGEAPFKGDSPRGILKSILSDSVSIGKTFSKEAKDLICKLLNPDPEKRLGSGVSGIQEIKNHRFFKNVKWGDVLAKECKAPYIPRLSSDSEVCNIDQVGQLGSTLDRHNSHSRLGVTESNLSNFYFNANDCEAM